jgi:hypothetical protein
MNTHVSCFDLLQGIHAFLKKSKRNGIVLDPSSIMSNIKCKVILQIAKGNGNSCNIVNYNDAIFKSMVFFFVCLLVLSPTSNFSAI